ncbi:MAG: hydantoinase B/oxoprolinase family protein [Pseudomonadota bacterium]
MQELTIQLAWNRLLAIVEEQAQVLMRTAFSTVVREAGDLSAGVFNLRGEMLAQAVTGTPGHVNSMAAAVGKFLARYPLQSLHAGDVLLTNDPWDGTGHLNDFTVVTPVFSNSRCVALFASTSHIADVGGRGFGPDANDVFEEGIRIPISYLFQAGQINDVLMDLLKANVRDPLVAEGDLYSLTACNEAGAVQLLEMLEDLALDDLEAVGDVILQRSRDAMRQALQQLPQHQVVYQMVIDGYDVPVTLQATLQHDGERLLIDFTGTSPASNKGINVPLAYTQAYATFGVRCVVGNEIPNNAGSLGVVEVTAPEGCLVNALPPRAVSARHAIGQMLPDVVLGCLQQWLPETIPAEGASCIWNPVFMQGADAQTGSNSASDQFVINPIFNGGTGARAAKDGLATTAFPSGVRTTSTEVNEATSPLILWCKEYTPDSCGTGRQRGGLGQTIEISHRQDVEFVISKMFDRVLHPARGRDGGGDGACGRVFVRDGTGIERDLPGKGRDVVPAGQRLVMQTPGGGGMGDPAQRRPSDIDRDQRDGLVNS